MRCDTGSHSKSVPSITVYVLSQSMLCGVPDRQLCGAVHKITGSPRMTSSGHFIIFIISININSLIMLNYAERIIEAGFTEKISNSD